MICMNACQRAASTSIATPYSDKMFVRTVRPLSRSKARFTSTKVSKRPIDITPEVSVSSLIQNIYSFLSFHLRNGLASLNKGIKTARQVSTSSLPNATEIPGNPKPLPGASVLNVKFPSHEVDTASPIQVVSHISNPQCLSYTQPLAIRTRFLEFR